jgi:hypothetical protein
MSEQDQNKPETQNLSSAVDELADATASGIENANLAPDVDEIIQDKMEEMNNPDVMTDSEGTIFDPELHATTKSGDPSITSTGKFRKKTGAAINKPQKMTATAAKTVQDERAKAVTCMGSAKTTVNTIGTFASGLMSPSWDITEKEEKDRMENAFYKYYMTFEKEPDLPPVLGLVFVMGLYALPRVMKPDLKTETKLQKLSAKVSDGFAVLKNRLKRNSKNATYASDRTNGKREIVNSEANSAENS